jgi:hypothetical protein
LVVALRAVGPAVLEALDGPKIVGVFGEALGEDEQFCRQRDADGGQGLGRGVES